MTRPRRHGARRSISLAALAALALLAAAFAAVPALAGGSWEVVPVSAPRLLAGAEVETLFALDGGTAWEAGSGNSLFFTHDGGASWAAQQTGAPQTTVWHSVRFSDLRHGLIAGADGETGLVYETADGGRSWRLRLTVPGTPLTQLETHGAGRAWVSGAGGAVYASADGGATWTQTRSAADVHLNAVSFADAAHGIAVGDGGTILRSVDGGGTWTRVASRVRRDLHEVACVTPDLALSVGARGTVLRSTDGGRTWKRLDVPAARGADCLAVDFETRLHGLIAVAGGRLLTTTDGGRTWRAVPHRQAELGALCDVDFATPPDGTAAAVTEARRLASRSAAPSWREAGSSDPNRAWTAAPNGTTAKYRGKGTTTQENVVVVYAWWNGAWLPATSSATMDFDLQFQNITGGQPYDGWSAGWSSPCLTITFNAGRSGSAEPAQGFTSFCAGQEIGCDVDGAGPSDIPTPSELNFWFWGDMTATGLPGSSPFSGAAVPVAFGQGHSEFGHNNWWLGIPPSAGGSVAVSNPPDWPFLYFGSDPDAMGCFIALSSLENVGPPGSNIANSLVLSPASDTPIPE